MMTKSLEVECGIGYYLSSHGQCRQRAPLLLSKAKVDLKVKQTLIRNTFAFGAWVKTEQIASKSDVLIGNEITQFRGYPDAQGVFYIGIAENDGSGVDITKLYKIQKQQTLSKWVHIGLSYVNGQIKIYKFKDTYSFNLEHQFDDTFINPSGTFEHYPPITKLTLSSATTTMFHSVWMTKLDLTPHQFTNLATYRSSIAELSDIIIAYYPLDNPTRADLIDISTNSQATSLSSAVCVSQPCQYGWDESDQRQLLHTHEVGLHYSYSPQAVNRLYHRKDSEYLYLYKDTGVIDLGTIPQKSAYTFEFCYYLTSGISAGDNIFRLQQITPNQPYFSFTKDPQLIAKFSNHNGFTNSFTFQQDKWYCLAYSFRTTSPCRNWMNANRYRSSSSICASTLNSNIKVLLGQAQAGLQISQVKVFTQYFSYGYFTSQMLKGEQDQYSYPSLAMYFPLDRPQYHILENTIGSNIEFPPDSVRLVWKPTLSKLQYCRGKMKAYTTDPNGDMQCWMPSQHKTALMIQKPIQISYEIPYFRELSLGVWVSVTNPLDKYTLAITIPDRLDLIYTLDTLKSTFNTIPSTVNREIPQLPRHYLKTWKYIMVKMSIHYQVFSVNYFYKNTTTLTQYTALTAIDEYMPVEPEVRYAIDRPSIQKITFTPTLNEIYIREISLFNGFISPESILNKINAHANPVLSQSPNLLAYLPLTEGTGNVLYNIAEAWTRQINIQNAMIQGNYRWKYAWQASDEDEDVVGRVYCQVEGEYYGEGGVCKKRKGSQISCTQGVKRLLGDTCEPYVPSTSFVYEQSPTQREYQACHPQCRSLNSTYTTCSLPFNNLTCMPEKCRPVNAIQYDPEADACLTTCKDGYYPITDVFVAYDYCVPCQKVGCKCISPDTGANSCTSCIDQGKQHITIGANSPFCQLRCPDGEFYDKYSTIACQKCHSQCTTCIGPTSQHCYRCNTTIYDFTPSNLIYVDHQPIYVGNCELKALPISQYRKADLTGDDCHQACGSCKGPDILDCLTCNHITGYVNYTGSCTQCSSINNALRNPVQDGQDCSDVCGNGVWYDKVREQCDDGNFISGDGCDRYCQVEAGYDCKGVRSQCKDVQPPSAVMEEVVWDVENKGKFRLRIEVRDNQGFPARVESLTLKSGTDLNLTLVSTGKQLYTEWSAVAIKYTNLTQKTQHIQVNLQVNSNLAGNELLSIKFINHEIWKDTSGLPLSTDTLTYKMSYKYLHINDRYSLNLNFIGRLASSSIILMILLSVLINICIGGTLQGIWELMNDLQIIYYIPLMQVPIPGLLVAGIKYIGFSTFTYEFIYLLVPGFPIIPNLIETYLVKKELLYDKALVANFVDFGYESSLFLITYSEKISFWVIIIGAYPILLIFRNITSCGCRCFQKLLYPFKKLETLYRFNLIIRTYTELYLEMSIMAFLNMWVLSYDNYLQTICSIIALLVMFIASLAPSLIFTHIQLNMRKLSSATFIARYGELVQNLKIKRASVAPQMWVPLFLFRRMLYSLCLVLLYYFPRVQILNSILLTLMIFIYLTLTRPFDSLWLNLVNHLNQICIISIFVLVSGFLLRSISESDGITISIAALSIIAFTIMFNLFLIYMNIVITIIKKYIHKKKGNSRQANYKLNETKTAPKMIIPNRSIPAFEGPELYGVNIQNVQNITINSLTINHTTDGMNFEPSRELSTIIEENKEHEIVKKPKKVVEWQKPEYFK